MAGKTFHGIDLFGRFMKLIDNISERTTARSEHTISHVGSKLGVWFGKVSGNLIGKG